MTLRKKIHDILEINIKRDNKLSIILNLALSVLIVLNSLAIILHSVPSLSAQYDQLFLDFELFSVVIFSLEYLLRVWSITEKEAYKQPIKGRIKYMLSPWALIDLLAIFPFYYSMFSTDLGFVRMLRLLRIIRLFRYSRYFHAIALILKVLKDKKEELLLSLSFCMFLLLISSSLVYFVEHEAQPQMFASIPDALWWGVNAMTTVGYGDLHPITGLGKVLGGIIAILGVCFFALPTGILASGFHDQIMESRNEKKMHKCPHCGHWHK
jgi:voltage-gated potassium channel